jgi:hypothetical protein
MNRLRRGVGSADSLTLADRRLPSVDAVQALLEWLATRPPAGVAAAAPDLDEPTADAAPQPR